MIQFSILTKDNGILTKSYALSGGKLVKDSSQCFLDKGMVEMMDIEFSDLPAVLDGLSSSQAIAHGIVLEAVNGPVQVVSRKMLPSHPGAVTRTLDKFFWPETGIIMFDYDPVPGTEPLAMPDLIRAIRSLDPQLETAAMVWRPSASSNIVGEDGTVYSGLRNQRVYIQYENPQDMEEFIQNLFRSAWDKDLGYIFITAAGIPLDRCIFDMAVFSPERLDFAAGGHCGKGLVKQEIKSVFFPGTAVDLSVITNHVDVMRHDMLVSAAKRNIEGDIEEKRAEYVKVQAENIADRQGISKAKARNIVEARLDHNLMPDDILYSDDMEPILIREVIEDPDHYNGMIIRDPLEPEYGKSKAKIFVDDDGVCVHSFAHGKQIYRLKYDVDYVLAQLEKVSPEEVEETWKRYYNNTEITPVAKDKLAKFVAKQINVSKAAVSKEMTEIDKKVASSRKPSQLTHNEMAMGVIAQLGDRVIATEGSLYSFEGNRWVSHPPSSAMNKVIALYDGCDLCKSVGNYKAITGHIIDLLDKPKFFSELPPIIATTDAYWRLDTKNATVDKVNVDKEMRVRFVLPFESKAGREPKMLLTFLEWAFEKDPEQIKLVQEIMGAVFFGVLTRIWQKAVLFKGTGQNGKSTLLDIITGMMPREFISDVSPDKFHDDNHKILLAGKLLNICPELEKGKALPSAAFKSIVDAGTITARAVYERAASFDSTAAHMFSANHRLVLNDDSKGMKRRWLFLAFDSTIPDEQKIAGYASEIVKRESAEIFNWAIDGVCRLYKNNNFTATLSNDKIAGQTFVGQNPLADFLADTDVVELLSNASCTVTPAAEKKYFVVGKALYAEYRAWFDQNVPSKKGNEALDYKVFCSVMEDRYGGQCRVDNKRGWKGIKLVMREKR
jgi:P4 family phage/plasmid primase-like protien